MAAEQSEEFVLLCGELCLFLAYGEQLFLCVESEVAHLVDRALLVLLPADTAQDSLNAEDEFFHRERLRDIVVGTDFESFEDILLQLFRREEDDGHVGVRLAYLVCESEAVFLRHHDIEDADVVLLFCEGTVACLSVGEEFSAETLCLQIFTQEHAEVLVVLAKHDFDVVFHIHSRKVFMWALKIFHTLYRYKTCSCISLSHG